MKNKLYKLNRNKKTVALRAVGFTFLGIMFAFVLVAIPLSINLAYSNNLKQENVKKQSVPVEEPKEEEIETLDIKLDWPLLASLSF